MSLSYGGAYLLPGMGTEYTTQEQQIWFGREEQQLFMGAVLDTTATDDGNTSYTHILRPGLALGMIQSTKKLAEWDPYATDGRQVLFGFFCGQQNMQQYGAAAERLVGHILVKGNVYASRLLYDGLTTYGIASTAYEFLLRQQMQGRFMVDDDPAYGLMNWKVLEKAFTSGSDSITLTRLDNRTIVSSIGSDAAGTIVLPAPKPGYEFAVEMVADQHVTVDGPATGEFVNIDLASPANTDQFDEDDKQFVIIRGIRVASTPTYQYKISGWARPPAVA